MAPVPLHWRRLLYRRYNQSALLAHYLGAQQQLPVIPDLLLRHKATLPQKGMSRSERFANQAQAIKLHPRQAGRIQGETVLLVDDVMTTGATLSACTRACFQAGAKDVKVVVLARVARPE